MLYEGNNPIIKIIGIEHMHWEQGIYKVEPRKYSALAFRISGCARIVADKKEYCINSNDVLYLPQNIGYTAEYTDTEVIVFHFETLYNDKNLEVYSFKNTEQVYKLFISSNALWANKEPGYNVYVTAQLYLILGLMLERSAKALQPDYFLKAMSFINSNYKNNALCVNLICNEAGISATQFRKLFKKYFQKTPMQYITELRLEYARNLISNGISIKAASIESGFNDTKYFARVVKKHLGCNPRELKDYGK